MIFRYPRGGGGGWSEIWNSAKTRARVLKVRVRNRVRDAVLDFLDLPEPQRRRRSKPPDWSLQARADPYSDWVRKKESAADLGRELLSDEIDFADWASRFGPEPENWPDEEGEPFYIPAPLTYPAIVVWTRIHRDGLVACEFYWDYVTPADFGEVQ